MRYIVVPQTMDKIHPLWPNEKLFFIKDLDSGKMSYSCYTTYKVAQEIVEKKNKQ